MSKSEMVRIVTQLEGKVIKLAWLEHDCLCMVIGESVVKVIGGQLYIRVERKDD